MPATNSFQKLILGTVQFGIPYGINNLSEKEISEEEVFKILDYAKEKGISTLDTAEEYGKAIERIRKFQKEKSKEFGIISKVKNATDSHDLKGRINESRKYLGSTCFDAYLFHDFNAYFNKPDQVKALNELKKQGLINKVGVSIYGNEELKHLIAEPAVDLIQLPFNILDNFGVKGKLIKRAKDANKTIHVRSVFLQGLFFKPYSDFPEKLTPLIPFIQQLETIAEGHEISLQSLAFNYPFWFEEIDGVLVGVDSLEQLKSNISILENQELNKSIIDAINDVQVSNHQLLNPTDWS